MKEFTTDIHTHNLNIYRMIQKFNMDFSFARRI